ncbi:hypothetical protein [Algoriphagus yeomjeoni]|uniref:Uncharacterized protein n=1 Tax=Algoriphagus yeomjeoni TaxID=291403 RepID=A0A327PPP5_9BACT|nr:hypothetical protein [Algoriphagus yeomjeoni]RAI94088.1 hypothetical protein LV83_00995 [Algoriphagus yeomjeoni]
MKRILIVMVLITIAQVLVAQENINVNEKRYKGIIFSATYEIPYQTNPPSELRFTPTIKEVRKLENHLQRKIKSINQDQPNQQEGAPVIHRNLNNYVRQYIGYITPEGERIIYVNFLWSKLNIIEKSKGYSLLADDYKEEWLQVFDGGSRYWQLRYNLNSDEFFGFSVNGYAGNFNNRHFISPLYLVKEDVF